MPRRVAPDGGFLLESQFETQLNVPRRISRGNRPETRIRSNGVESVVVGNVRSVEEIALELQVETLCDCEMLRQRQVVSLQAGTFNDARPRVSKPVRWSSSECGLIEPKTRRRIVDCDRPANPISTTRPRGGISRNSKVCTRLRANDAAKLPSTHSVPNDSRVLAERRQLPYESTGED